MSIIETEDFKKDLKDFPSDIRRLFQKQKAIFKQNWLDPRLHTKRITWSIFFSNYASLPRSFLF
jgi:mRNA-degrading endonuclease RelE of RelBE toxin-antitoxin system